VCACGWLTVCARVGRERDHTTRENTSRGRSKKCTNLRRSQHLDTCLKDLAWRQRSWTSAVCHRSEVRSRRPDGNQSPSRRDDETTTTHTVGCQRLHTIITHTPPRHTASGTPGSIFCGHTSFEYTAVKRLMPRSHQSPAPATTQPNTHSRC
jgi:hypothetical protein